jgi:hypothetical protein|tara:strand:+ start:462 stop:698 length:237 start_codon:yes stop_codon:yes gene_type:complete
MPRKKRETEEVPTKSAMKMEPFIGKDMKLTISSGESESGYKVFKGTVTDVIHIGTPFLILDEGRVIIKTHNIQYGEII